MHPLIVKILDDAGATAEDRAVMEALGNTIVQETRDALASAQDCLPPRLRGVGGVYFARAIEAAMVKEYERWKTDDAPEG